MLMGLPEHRMKQIELGTNGSNTRLGFLQNFPENGHLQYLITSSVETGCTEVFVKSGVPLNYYLGHF